MANFLSHSPQDDVPFPLFVPCLDDFEDWSSTPFPYSVVRRDGGRYFISICADGLPPVSLASLSGEMV